MELRFIHFYPDLMSLYGSYANVAVLRRYLERLGNAVTVEAVRPGEAADLSGADFLFMGAGTEHSARAAMEDFSRFGPAVRAAAEDGAAMLFAGTAMELLGASVTDGAGRVWPCLGFADFTTTEHEWRYPRDVVAEAQLWEGGVVGFMNKCSSTRGVKTPLFRVEAGYEGNTGDPDLDLDGGDNGEGYVDGNVFATHLTGPVLVKNPDFVDFFIKRIFSLKGWELPETLPVLPYEREAYAVTLKELADQDADPPPGPYGASTQAQVEDPARNQ